MCRFIITRTSHERYDVSNHRHIDCLFSSLFRTTTKEASKPLITDRWIPLTRNTETFPGHAVIVKYPDAVGYPVKYNTRFCCYWSMWYMYPQYSDVVMSVNRLVPKMVSGGIHNSADCGHLFEYMVILSQIRSQCSVSNKIGSFSTHTRFLKGSIHSYMHLERKNTCIYTILIHKVDEIGWISSLERMIWGHIWDV